MPTESPSSSSSSRPKIDLRGMFRSPIFTGWFCSALAIWAALFANLSSFGFLASHWHYPLIMVLGAFVAGLTPEGGGAVAFPMLSLFFELDRPLARDFSLMIQSVGMTSATLFILTDRGTDRSAFRPLLGMLPVGAAGFVIGMLSLQQMPVYLIQALFLSLIMAFTLAYACSAHRGERLRLEPHCKLDLALLAGVLLLGGMCASLFGTGSDILLYSLLVTRFRLNEKVATRMSIMLMAGMSLFGFAYRHFVEAALTGEQVQTWLCAYPVVLFMAPFGAWILSRIETEWMLRGIVLLNIGQLLYFNLRNPTTGKWVASVSFSLLLLALFFWALTRLGRQQPSQRAPRVAEGSKPAQG
jgi:uncharacterized membrane protein YfcA